MPISAPRIYPNVFHRDNRRAIRDLVAFLVDDHASFTGPGWSIVEAYDGTEGSRQVPGTASGIGTLASFTGTFSWKDNTVAVGDWIVLRSNFGGGAPEFQFFWQVSSTTAWEYLLIPLDDFETGSALTSSPVLPATAVGQTAVAVSYTTADAWYSAVADEQMFEVLRTRGGGTAVTWGYVGSVNQAHPNDERPFVIYDRPNNAAVYTPAGAFWSRLSPIDQRTILGAGYWSWTRRGNGNLAQDDLWLMERSLLPVGVAFTTAGHEHLAGVLRNVYQGQHRLGFRSVLGNREYVVATNNVTHSPLVMPWDGVTPW